MSATNPPFDATRTSGRGPMERSSTPILERIAPESRSLDERPVRRVRLDPIGTAPHARTFYVLALWSLLAGGFVLVGGGNLDPGSEEARLGLAAGEGLGPLGQVYGGWDPALWPLPVMAAQAWAWGEGGTPTTAAIRWPQAMAGVLIGLVLSRSVSRSLGRRAALFLAVCLFGSLGFIHRASGFGGELLPGLFIIAALDRLLAGRADWCAGLWAALAVLSGGWPPLLMILLPLVVVGEPGARFTARLLLPPALALAVWSAWTLSVSTPELWAAALTLPLTRPRDWSLVPSVLALGMPWAPLGALMVLPGFRRLGKGSGRTLILRWLQVVGVACLVGTVLPGMADSSRVVAIAGLAIAAATILARITSTEADPWSRRLLGGYVLALALLWLALAIGLGGYLAAAVSYYRPLCVGLVIAAYGLAVTAFAGAWLGRTSWSIGALVTLAICWKVAHWGVYVPEWNYRIGQGPWGRAIGQWVLPNRPIYVFSPWPDHLMFHTERPVRLLSSEIALKYRDLSVPQYVLLRESEFTHWPETAPPIQKVRGFRDERGGKRILARTEGDLDIRPHAPDWD